MICEHMTQLSCINMINDLSDMATFPVLDTRDMVISLFFISNDEIL